MTESSENRQREVGEAGGGHEQDAVRKVISDKRFDKYMGRDRKVGVELASMGVELAGIVGGFVGGGWWLDEKFETSPLFIIFGLVFGAVGGVYRLWRVGKTFFRKR